MKNISVAHAQRSIMQSMDCRVFFTLLIVPVLLVFGIKAKGQEQSYTVVAKISHATAANEAHLVYYKGIDPVYATAKLENGRYIFKGVAPSPVIASFFLDNKGIGYGDGKFQDKLQIRLEQGSIRIEATDSVKYAKVTAGPYNKDYQQYKDFIEKESSAVEFFNASYVIGWQNKLPKEHLDKFQSRLMEATEHLKSRIMQYVKTHPNSYSSADALSSILGSRPDLSVMQPLFDGLSPEIKETPAGRKLREMLETARGTGIGAVAPMFTLPDTSDKPVNLKDFRGKYLLLDFWASWCGPCRAENPNYIMNYKKYHGKGLEMLGVSLDKEGDKSKWIAAINKDGLLWPQVSDLKYWKGKVVELYGIRSIPQNFLIDPNGKIVAVNLRGEDLGKKLSEIFDR